VKRLLYIAYFLEVGLLLVLVPWSGFWDHNYFLGEVPRLQAFLSNHFVRGAVSGLGIVNLWAGLIDLGALVSMRRFDPPPPPVVMRVDGGSTK
jgi:hypothetical protein